MTHFDGMAGSVDEGPALCLIGASVGGSEGCPAEAAVRLATGADGAPNEVRPGELGRSLRDFQTLYDAYLWALARVGGRRVKVIIGQSVYALDVNNAATDQRRTIIRNARVARIWNVAGRAAALAWVASIVYMQAIRP